MKNQKKIFQKFFRNVSLLSVHADIKDSNLQIEVQNFDEILIADNSENFVSHFQNTSAAHPAEAECLSHH